MWSLPFEVLLVVLGVLVLELLPTLEHRRDFFGVIPLDLVLVLVLGSALVLGELVAEAHSYLAIATDIPAPLNVRLVMAERRRKGERTA